MSLERLNRRHAAANEGDSRLESRIAAYELAARLQQSAPEALDLSGESRRRVRSMDSTTRPRPTSAADVCWRGGCWSVASRFVQVWSGAGGPTNNWDNHADIPSELPPMARSVDRPIAGLLRDLKARGLLDDTLVVCSTEFGRQPFTQGATGRDHNGGTSVAWLAGAGIKGGAAHGESDPWAWRPPHGQTYCYDLHATILHLMGIDHTKLTFRHNGIDRRLTDVHGHVVEASYRSQPFWPAGRCTVC